MKTVDAARGKWRGILLTMQVPKDFLSKKHGPCPFCGGSDRFRFDDKGGSGSFFCSGCGAGDGVEFVKRFKGLPFLEAAQEIDKIVGNVKADPIKPPVDPERARQRLNTLWAGASRLTGDDPASRYLIGRGAFHGSSCLRYHPNCPKPHQEGFGVAMLARVTGKDGQPVNIHRTFLANPAAGEKRLRATMQGELPEGCAVRLFPAGKVLGIAEGIETAIKAAKRFEIPVWSALNATMLSKWIAPEGVEHVVVFGDNDAAFGGQAAAYALAHRLVTRQRIKAEVMIPETTGTDWADYD